MERNFSNKPVFLQSDWQNNDIKKKKKEIGNGKLNAGTTSIRLNPFKCFWMIKEAAKIEAKNKV